MSYITNIHNKRSIINPDKIEIIEKVKNWWKIFVFIYLKNQEAVDISRTIFITHLKYPKENLWLWDGTTHERNSEKETKNKWVFFFSTPFMVNEEESRKVENRII